MRPKNALAITREREPHDGPRLASDGHRGPRERPRRLGTFVFGARNALRLHDVGGVSELPTFSRQRQTLLRKDRRTHIESLGGQTTRIQEKAALLAGGADSEAVSLCPMDGGGLRGDLPCDGQGRQQRCLRDASGKTRSQSRGVRAIAH